MHRLRTLFLVASFAAPAMLAGCGGASATTTGGRFPGESTKAPPSGSVLRGRASYYHDSLAGNATANGEIYDPALLTAANRTLPFGTMLRVTRIDNGMSVVVRVNDRGPFGRRTRILDLSRAAAQKLQMIRAGVVDVRAEVLSIPN
ncbi:MAG: septal ring lytic transglycosylase RlpA family protein [Polyangiales bacterium]